MTRRDANATTMANLEGQLDWAGCDYMGLLAPLVLCASTAAIRSDGHTISIAIIETTLDRAGDNQIGMSA